MIRRRRRFGAGAILLGILICLTSPTLAQDGPIAIYDEGSLSFHYAQWPWGSYEGDFSAEGALLDSLLWGSEQLESCGGSLETNADTTFAWGYGAVYNADDTVDLAGLFVRSAGELAPGSYPVDVTDFMADFFYFDDISDFTIPENPDSITDWLGLVEAEHKFLGASGSITVAAVSDTSFAGSFSGTMLDPESLMVIEITSGLFAYTGAPVTTGVPAEIAPGLTHGSYPNPFNPRTRLRLALAEARTLRVTVHDVRGRELSVLYEGELAAGEHAFEWSATDAGGRTLPAGLYLYRIAGDGVLASGKMLLLP